MIKRLFLLAVIMLVAIPASFSVLAQDDLTETLELEDFGFTMSYPDGWTEAGDINEDGFVALLEDEDDFENATDFAALNGQVVLIIAAPEESLEELGEDAGERLSALAESFDGDLSANDVEEIEIAGGYPTAVGAPEVEDAFVIIAEVIGEEGFAFFLIGISPVDDAEDLLANVGGMLDTIEIGEGSGGDDGGDDGGDADTGDAEAVEYGDTVEGEITDDTPAVIYTFEASEGDVVTITMVDTSRDGGLDPYVGLLNEDGDVIAENDDAEDDDAVPDSFDSQIAEFEIEDDGVYFIVATRFGQDNGSSEGDYELTIEEGSGGGGSNDDDDDDSGDSGDVEIIAIEYGDTVEGEVTDDEVYVYYSFEGEEGDVVTITVVDVSRSGDLDPYVGLADENGEIIAENDDADSDADLPDTFDSQITEFELPEDGVYTIIATRYGFEDGSGEGEIEVTLESE